METRRKNLLRVLGMVAVIVMIAGCVPPATPTAAPPAPTSTTAPAATKAPAATTAPAPTAAPAATVAPTKPAVELAASQVLRYGTVEDDAPAGFDPIKTTASPSMDIQKEIYNALLRLTENAKNNQDIEPDLATKWETSPDGLTWTFTLRQGVQFQKGFGEFTSEDVVFTFNRARAKGSSWASSFSKVTDVIAVDKYTVKIVTSATDPYFLYKMSNASDAAAVIVSKKAVEQYGDKYTFNPIGTGPFQFDSYQPKQKVVLVANPTYFRGKPIITRLEYLFIPEVQTQAAALKAGELEIMRGDQDPSFVADQKKAGLVVLSGVPFALPLAFNLTIKPFDDLKVRQAVRYAIDTQAFVDFYGKEFVLADQGTLSIWPWNQGVYQAAKGVVKSYNYDPAKAKQLLTEAGYANGFTVDLQWTNQVRFKIPMEIVQAQLAKVGIKINLTIVEHSKYREVIDSVKGQAMSMISASRDTPDAIGNEWFSKNAVPGGSKAKYNYARYGVAIPGVDDLLTKATSEPDLAKAIPTYVEIEKRVAEDLPVICLFQGASEPFVHVKYLDLGYTFNAPDRRYPIITEKTRILKH